MDKNYRKPYKYAYRFRLWYTVLNKNIEKHSNQFLLDVFNAHIELQSKNQPKEIHEFQASAIFYNKKIKVANTSIYYQSCYECGIKLKNDITGKKMVIC